MIGDEVTYVYLRLSAGARHSQVDFDEIEDLADSAELQNDGRDDSLYVLAVPGDIESSHANKIISALVTKSYIDEAWTDNTITSEIKPQFFPK